MSFLLHIIISISHWLPTVLGYNLVFGKGKLFHFGPLGVSLATGYAMFLTILHTNNVFLGILAGTLMAVSLSALYLWLSLRLDADAFGVMTIALHLSILAIVLNWTSVTRGALGIPGIPRLPFLESIRVYALFTFIIAACFVYVFYRIDRSAYGRKLSALAEHEWHAKSLGVDSVKTYGIAFLLLALASVAGNFMFAPYIRFLHPNDYHFPAFIFLIMVVIAGKPGSVRGAVLAAVLITLLKEGLRFVPMDPGILGPMRLILFGLILFAVIWWRRDTLFPNQRTV